MTTAQEYPHPLNAVVSTANSRESLAPSHAATEYILAQLGEAVIREVGAALFQPFLLAE
ncbi:hypothetical protein [Sandarakinorhabdus glacialis]|uniref:hypothetical protein n=1 Tax=Sandarakinorhabdus glacialis TaxID=1614636 RepID=UPI0016652275|nr:hypothetical protein [Polymorphobacter glacialis]